MARRKKAAPASPWRSRIVDHGEAAPAELVANPENWRTHPRHQAAALGGVLAEIGWVQEVLVNRTTGRLIDGHLRVELAAARGEASVPVTFVELTEAEERLVLATLDPLAALATTDRGKLEGLLAGLSPEAPEVRQMLADLARGAGLDRPKPGLTDEDAPGAERDQYVTQGEVWELGDHRLVVGDSRDREVVLGLSGSEGVDLVWTDPPYGVSYVGKTRDALTIENDELAGDELTALLEASLGNAKDALRPGASIYVAAPGGDRAWQFVDVLMRLGLYRQTIVWVKDVFVMGRSDYHWRHELLHLGVTPGKATKASSPVLYRWRRGAAHYFVPERDLDTVWEIARPKASREHPTTKPVELVRRCLSFSSRRGDTVLDPFLGSGTTLIAAETIDRRCLAVELDPVYAQRSIERWQAFTGKEARRAE